MTFQNYKMYILRVDQLSFPSNKEVFIMNQGEPVNQQVLLIFI